MFAGGKKRYPSPAQMSVSERVQLPKASSIAAIRSMSSSLIETKGTSIAGSGRIVANPDINPFWDNFRVAAEASIPHGGPPQHLALCIAVSPADHADWFVVGLSHSSHQKPAPRGARSRLQLLGPAELPQLITTRMSGSPRRLWPGQIEKSKSFARVASG